MAPSSEIPEGYPLYKIYAGIPAGCGGQLLLQQAVRPYKESSMTFYTAQPTVKRLHSTLKLGRSWHFSMSISSQMREDFTRSLVYSPHQGTHIFPAVWFSSSRSPSISFPRLFPGFVVMVLNNQRHLGLLLTIPLLTTSRWSIHARLLISTGYLWWGVFWSPDKEVPTFLRPLPDSCTSLRGPIGTNKEQVWYVLRGLVH